MPRLRRVLAALTAMAALAATSACGAGQPQDRGAQEQGGDRVVTHAMGQATIHGQPKRVVVLDTGELDEVLALGVRPVGAVAPDAGQSLQPYLADKAKGVEMVGTVNQPNLERIAALKPDLILSSKLRNENKYDQLSKIAPTVMAETVGKSWKDNFLLAGEALGKKPQAEQMLGDYQKKAQAIGQQVGNPGATEVSMVRFVGNDIRLYGEGSFIGTILNDVGFARTQIQRNDKTFTKVSQEQLAQADGGIVFYSAFGPSAEEKLNQIVSGPQWQNLDAVKNQQAFKVADDSWFLGLGPIGANLVLDELPSHVVKK